jgi:hypothetical protein
MSSFNSDQNLINVIQKHHPYKIPIRVIKSPQSKYNWTVRPMNLLCNENDAIFQMKAIIMDRLAKMNAINPTSTIFIFLANPINKNFTMQLFTTANDIRRAVPYGVIPVLQFMEETAFGAVS